MLFIDSAPIVETRQSLEIPNQSSRVDVGPNLLIAQFQLVPPGATLGGSTSPTFPLIIDTGHAHNLSLNAHHLRDWFGIDPANLPPLGSVRTVYADGSEGQIQLLDSNVRLFSNIPGQEPVIIDLDYGFMYYDSEGPPIPLLGAQALVAANLNLQIDYENMNFSLGDDRTRPEP